MATGKVGISQTVSGCPGLSTDTAAQLCDKAQNGKIYTWVGWNAVTYNPTQTSGNWAYMLYKNSSSNYSFFMAHKNGEIWQYDHAHDKWIPTNITQTKSISDLTLDTTHVDTTATNSALNLVRYGNVVSVAGYLKLKNLTAWSQTDVVTAGLFQPAYGRGGVAGFWEDHPDYSPVSFYVGISGILRFYNRGLSLTTSCGIYINGSYII